MFEEKFGVFSAYPFSKTLRAEMGASLAHYSYKITSDNYYYLNYDPYYGGYGYLGFERKDENAPDGFNFHEINTAFVGDNSVFGMTAPMKGQRFRVGVQKYFGKNNLSTFTFDYRKYIFVKPVTFAFKASHYNRFGPDAEKNYYNDGGILPPLYLGYDYFVRGYSYEAMYESAMVDPTSLGYNQLMGSKMLLANFEVRLPFTGPKRLAVIKSGMFFTDLNFFVDAGIIWDAGNTLSMKKDKNNPSVRYPIYSTGVSARINLFGQIIIQPYYAFPLTLKTGSRGYFGLNFYPGF
jgi:outer membrane protein assembly factor BamA